MRKVLFVFSAVILLTCTACHENADSSAVDMTNAPELAGTMRPTAPATEAPVDDEDIPNLEPTKAWIDYGSYGGISIYSKNLPETEHIILTHDSQIYKIDTMVGGIEQRFFESGIEYQETVNLLSGMWEKFTGETLEEKKLSCQMKDKNMSFRAIPEEEYPDIEVIDYLSHGTIMQYFPEEGSVMIVDNPERELVSEYTQTYNEFPMTQFEMVYDPENNQWSRKNSSDDTHIYSEDSVILNGEEVMLLEIEKCIYDFLSGIYADSFDETRKRFLKDDYAFHVQSLRIENYSDGNQGIFMNFSLTSRDMPVIFDNGTISGTEKQITGTRIEIGMFGKEKIGYLKTNYLINKPDEIQLTDPRPKMDGITLMDIDTAFSLADETLTESRNLETVQLQYGTEEIYTDGDLQGRVLTPVWHFVFEPTETELSENHTHMIIDIDAVTSQGFTWYSTETEQSGKKCWKSNPHWWDEMTEG